MRLASFLFVHAHTFFTFFCDAGFNDHIGMHVFYKCIHVF